MKYAIVFAALAVCIFAYAAVLGDWTWVLVWPAGSFLVVAAAYAGAGPIVLGKRPDGRFAAWSFVVNMPYFVVTWGVWYVQRRVTQEPACSELVPGVWIGRRPLPHEVPIGVKGIVDLTAEFSESAGVRTGRTYRSLPILDAQAPDESALVNVVREVATWEGPVLIHCALGHGRTGLFAATLLLVRQLAPDCISALALVRAVRPGVRLNRQQKTCLERIAEQIRTGASRRDESHLL